jgi:NADH-quinone oxidoreductase subunit G
MTKMINLTVDGAAVTVPDGTLVVDAAKKAGIDIPVFCYHPKMEPVGMCRMCLVEIGRPMIDRATNQLILESDGKPKLQFMPKLETACTNTVSEGMVVLTQTAKAKAGQSEIVEFLLTSHPLDCPICDKGGECPLQNLTMAHGSSQSRFLFDEKQKMEKHVALGELIYLDRERCIQCARCIRFQRDVAGDDVIGFYNRGRSTDIVTYSDPGFDSVFSGNTSDICPVGALTTADFRFGARAWELKSSASICAQCPVGCNVTFNIRREAKSGGAMAIKRVMPRQNESVNEIWICDKGRFAGYPFAESKDRLTQPLIRKDGKLEPASWNEALKLASAKLGAGSAFVASGRLSNEDLFNLKSYASAINAKMIFDSNMGGGDLTGLSDGFNLNELGKGSTILVAASDLYNEAPIWYLRVRSAVKRGATLIVANARATKLDDAATFVIRYAYGDEVETINGLSGKEKFADALKAETVVAFFGADGLGFDGTTVLASACANLVQGKRGGLIGAWQRANDQGAWELGLRPSAYLAGDLAKANSAYIVASDPIGDNPALAEALKDKFIVVQDLFLTATAQLADVVFPAQAYTEREGTFTNGERRVQRYYPAVPARGESKADFAITALLMGHANTDAQAVMIKLAETESAFAGISYNALAEVIDQYPIIGRGDMYYGGTAYDNKQGLGKSLTPRPSPKRERGASRGETLRPKENELIAVPVTKLYDRGTTITPALRLNDRIGDPCVVLNPQTAAKIGIAQGAIALVSIADVSAAVIVKLDESIAAGVALIPRSMGVHLAAPASVKISVAENVTQGG